MGITKMIKSKYIIFMLLIFIIDSFPCSAQKIDTPSKYHNLWISLNTGPNFRSVETNIYADISLEYSNAKSIYSIQYFGISKLPTFKPSSHSNKLHNFYGINLLYGLIHRNNINKISYSGGISLLLIPKILHTGEITNKTNYSLGIPLSLQVVLTLIRLIGIGMKINANINSKSSFIGTSIGLYFGKVSN